MGGGAGPVAGPVLRRYLDPALAGPDPGTGAGLADHAPLVPVAIAAVPVAGIVVPLVGKAHRDAVGVMRPELLDQAVFMLLGPFALQVTDVFSPVTAVAGIVLCAMSTL